MVSGTSQRKEAFWKEDPFNVIKSEEYKELGIDPSDIPPGTIPAHKHPPQLPSRFGGNAYGFGFFEIYDRLNKKDIKLLQSINFDDPDQVKLHYRDINQVYKRIGLLIRFSSEGRPYSLIPSNLISSSLSNIKNKVDEIDKIIEFHRKKYLKESHKIGLITSAEDSLVEDLSLRFKEHQFVIIESLYELQRMDETLDLVIIPKDPFRAILTDSLIHLSGEIPSKKQLEKYALFMMGKIYKMLKPDGEIFIIANRHALKTNRSAKITFKTTREKKNFLLFSHIFKTRKKYQIEGNSLEVNIFDLEKYISGFYVEQEVIDELVGGKNLDSISLKELDNLAYLNYSLDDELVYDQQNEWPKLLSVYFKEIFHKSLIPDSIKADWKTRFSIKDYSPEYMLIYLGQKRVPVTSWEELNKDIMELKLAGCPYPLLADYRDSFDYLIQVLHVLNNIKKDKYTGIPGLFMERLREPLENKRWRYSGLNDVIKLMSKETKLEKIRSYLNPDMIEGSRTKLLNNLDILPFFGIKYAEIKEILLIVLGHSTMGRILSGKMNEKTLKPVTDKARTFDHNEAVNLMRYCRLMSVAETAASQMTELKQEQVAMLFELYDSMVRIVTSRELDWDKLLDEKIASIGGIHNIIIQKLLKMMNLFEFIENWSELENKGDMEKESLADYDEKKLESIEKIIRLLNIIDAFEQKYMKKDPLLMPIFYRKLNNIEFHGTGHVFSRINSDLVFILLWISVNLNRGEVINFNPILSNVEYSKIDSHMKKVEKEAGEINRDYLDLATLKQLGDQIYENDSAFIVNTGFRLSLNKKTQALDISFIDMDENIKQLETLTEKFKMCPISDIPTRDLTRIESLFSNLESFYQGHLKLVEHGATTMKMPERQRNWFKKAGELREYIMANFMEVLFQPENIYDDLNRLYFHSRTILHFILPEFLALEDLKLVGKIYLRSPLIDHILKSTKKLQALIRKDRKEFQDIPALHKLAQREFGPMTAGIVGLNENQIEILENIIEHISNKESLFDALLKSFIFQDLGLLPELREKYKNQINTTDQARAGAVLLEKLKIPQRYNMDKEAEGYLAFLIKLHDRLHHIVRGEFTIHTLKEVIEYKDKDLFDAFFLSSFVMFSALGEDLIMEDLAESLFQIRTLCHQAIDGITAISDYLKEIYLDKGRLYYLLEQYRKKGLPEDKTPSEYLETFFLDNFHDESNIKSGEMICALERLFKLRGLRYMEFPDLASRMINIPLRYIYQKKNCYGIGYATFEKELFEALRVYNGIYRLPEETRHFILERLEGDQVRIFGFENVSVYLNYENIIKLLLITLLCSLDFKQSEEPVNLDFLALVEKIEKRYEVVNDLLNNLSVENIWKGKGRISQFFKEKTGIIFKKDEQARILICDFADTINMKTKITHMENIVDIDHLKNYFHYSLQSLRKIPFYTEDYEYQLEDAFYRRLAEITDLMLDQAQRRMQLLTDFREIHNLYTDLLERSLEIGFSDDQKHRLSDIYEFRKDQLKREKLNEINRLLEEIHEIEELRGYWDGVKFYLLDNRSYLGKEFEQIIAKKFDDTMELLKDI